MSQSILNFEQFLRRFFPQYVIDADNIGAVKKASLWAANDPAFEDESIGHLLVKGLCIIGPVGTGKTDFFYFLNRYLNEYLGSVNTFGSSVVWELTPTFNEIGYDCFKPHHFGNMFYDDLCLRSNSSNFPDRERSAKYSLKVVIGEELIMIRYNSFKLYGYQTHFSTNEDMVGIKEVYGERAESVLKSMCNILIINGSSKRDRYKPYIYRNHNNMLSKPKSNEISEDEITEVKRALDGKYIQFLESNIVDNTAPLDYILLKHYGCNIATQNELDAFKETLKESYVEPLEYIRASALEKRRHKEEAVTLGAKKIAVENFYNTMKQGNAKTIFGVVEFTVPHANAIAQPVSDVIKIEQLPPTT